MATPASSPQSRPLLAFLKRRRRRRARPGPQLLSERGAPWKVPFSWVKVRGPVPREPRGGGSLEVGATLPSSGAAVSSPRPSLVGEGCPVRRFPLSVEVPGKRRSSLRAVSALERSDPVKPQFPSARYFFDVCLPVALPKGHLLLVRAKSNFTARQTNSKI